MEGSERMLAEEVVHVTSSAEGRAFMSSAQTGRMLASTADTDKGLRRGCSNQGNLITAVHFRILFHT